MIVIAKPTASQLLRRGLEAHVARRWHDAIRDYTTVLALQSDCAEAFANRAAARGSLGETTGAFADYSRSLRLDPANADVWNNRGVLRRELGDHSGAILDFNRAIALNPDHADARANRAVIHHLRWDHAAAAQDLTHALSAPPGRYGVESRRWLLTIFRGDAFYHLGRTADAMTDYRTTFAQRPVAFAKFVCRTIATTVRDHGADAMLADCARHLERDPGDYLSFVRRSVIFIGLGRDHTEDTAACYRFGHSTDAMILESILRCARGGEP